MMNKDRKNNNKNFRQKPRENFADRRTVEIDECTVFGRNAVKELLASGRDVEKMYIDRRVIQ